MNPTLQRKYALDGLQMNIRFRGCVSVVPKYENQQSVGILIFNQNLIKRIISVLCFDVQSMFRIFKLSSI